MKTYLSMLGAVFAMILASGSLNAQDKGDDAPDFKFDMSWNVPEGFDELKDYRGKVVLIDRWATW